MTKKKAIYLLALSAIGIFTINACSKDDASDDDNCTEQTWYQDSDGDGFGDLNNPQQSCTQPTDYVLDNTDFDDANATAFPNADELCDDGIDNDGNGDIDECGITSQISGNWTDNFNGSYIITNSKITGVTANNTMYIYHILVVGSDFVICSNDPGNPFNADLFSKFVFTNISNNSFHFCQSFYDSPSQMSIENGTDPTNPNDLDAGCGGFAWSLMTRD